MPPLQVPGAAIVKLYWTISGGGIMMNALGAVVTGAPTFGQAHANALGSAIKGSLTSSGLVGLIHSSVTLAAVGVKDLRQESLTEFIDQNAAVVGTASGDALPRGTAFAVTLRTARSGPRYRGRVFLGGFAEGNNDPDATAGSTVPTLCVAFLTAVQGNFTSNGLSLGVISRPAEPVDVVITIHRNDGTDEVQTKHREGRPGQVNAVTLIQARNDTWDSQRRRTTPGSISSLFAPLASADLETGEMFTTGKASKPARSK